MSNASQLRPRVLSAGRSDAVLQRRLAGPRHVRRGSLMVEMVVCCILLSVVAAILVPGIHAVQKQRQAIQFEAYGLIELNNQAARRQRRSEATVLPQLSAWFSDRFPDAMLTVGPAAGVSKGDLTLSPARLTITRPSAQGPATKLTLVMFHVPQEIAE